MGRIVIEQEYAARRSEILTAARQLVYTRGFDSITLQDLLDELKISKGAFYHYFDSKSSLTQALVEHMVDDEILPLLETIASDPHLSAVQKLEGYFERALRWKTDRRDLMLSILRVWMADENAIFRQRLFTFSLTRLTPVLGEIVKQGVREGVFDAAYPDQVCRVIVYIVDGLSNIISELLLSKDERDPTALTDEVTNYVAALTQAIERVLGAAPGSLRLVELDTLLEWFDKEELIPAAPGTTSAGGFSTMKGS